MLPEKVDRRVGLFCLHTRGLSGPIDRLSILDVLLLLEMTPKRWKFPAAFLEWLRIDDRMEASR
nr:hypothetical protein RKHAN_02944 [Rhizobium sp. Khangiran2]